MISGGWCWSYCGTLRGMSFSDTPKPRRRTTLIVGIAVLATAAAATAAVLLISGRQQESPAAAASPATSAPSASPTQAVVLSTSPAAIHADPAALDACELVKKAQGTDDLYSPAKMRAAGQRAAQSANASVRIQGTRLTERADLAAKSGGKELSATLDMGTAATDLYTFCINDGLVVP